MARDAKRNRMRGIGNAEQKSKTSEVIEANFDSQEPDTPATSQRISLIPVENILEQEDNWKNYHEVDTVGLENSIEDVGLLHPIAVKLDGDGAFIVISGHRRLAAFKSLKDKCPEDPRFSKIPATVYVEEKLKSKLETNGKTVDPSYIIKTEAEIMQMYDDANLESRQLSFQDEIKHFEQLIKKIDDPKNAKWYESIKETIIERKRKEREEKQDAGLLKGKNRGVQARDDEIYEFVLKEVYGFDTWSSSSIRKYLTIVNTAQGKQTKFSNYKPNKELQAFAEKILNKIKEEEFAIPTGYEILSWMKSIPAPIFEQAKQKDGSMAYRWVEIENGKEIQSLWDQVLDGKVDLVKGREAFKQRKNGLDRWVNENKEGLNAGKRQFEEYQRRVKATCDQMDVLSNTLDTQFQQGINASDIQKIKEKADSIMQKINAMMSEMPELTDSNH